MHFSGKSSSSARSSSQRMKSTAQSSPSQSAPKAEDSSSRKQQSSPIQPNLESSNLYEVLGVPPDASTQQIKISYRKLALQYHPDKLSPQATESEKKLAHKNFTSIGHAYEILADETRRNQYDMEQQQQSSQRENYYNQSTGFQQDPFSMFRNDPFFSSFGRMNNSSNMRSAHSIFEEFHFTDPFDLFEKVFSDDMGRGHGRQRASRNGMDSFFGSDPFFSSEFGGASRMMSNHMGMMDSMMSQMNGGGGSSYNFISSSSSSGGGNHRSVSTSTRTTIVNGVQTTVTERTVVHPDGRVERHVETSGGETGRRNMLPSSSHPALGYDDSRGKRRR